MTAILGLLLGLASGVMTGSFSLPMKKTTRWSWEATWLTDAGALRLDSGYVTAGFFDVVQPRIIRGRGFQAGDDAPGSEVVVVTEGFWRQSLDGRPDVVGETCT